MTPGKNLSSNDYHITKEFFPDLQSLYLWGKQDKRYLESFNIADIYCINKSKEKIENQLPEKLTKKGNPRHNDLIAVIEDFKIATINSFWNGKEDKIPSETKVWCEVWLINNKNTHDEDVISEFINVTHTNNIEIRTESNIKFPERIITLAKLNAEDILNLIDSYQYLAEIRPY